MSNIRNLEGIEINNHLIEIVPDYRYLDQPVSFENRSDKEIKSRKANAWKAFWGQKIFWNGNLNLKAKIKNFRKRRLSLLRPTLFRPGQTLEKQIQKLISIQNFMLRRILKFKIKDKIRILEILGKT